MQADATLLANYSRHCGMLHVASVSHAVVCCYMFLRVIGSCCAKVESGQTFGPATPNILLFRDRRSVGPKNVGSVCTALPTLLGPRTRISHTWSPKSYGLYPSHDAVQVPTLLGVVASFCTPLPTRTQQLSTLLEPTMLRVVAPVCTPLPRRTQQLLTLKVKNDHRSKFSNLSNWKEEA